MIDELLKHDAVSRWTSMRDRVDTKVATKIAVAGALGWTLGLVATHLTDRPDSLVSGMWCAVTAMVVLQASLGGTYKAGWARFLGVIIGSILGGFWTSMLGSNPISLGISVFFTVIICSIINIKDSIRIACLSVSIVLILWGLRPTVSPWVFAFYRVMDSCIGITVAMGVAHFLWPFQATHKLRSNLSDILLYIRQIYQLVTNLELGEQSVEEEYIQLRKEIDPLIQENIAFLDEAKLELLMRPERLNEWVLLHDQARQLLREVVALKPVYRRPKKILDTNLLNRLSTLIEQTQLALQKLSQALSSRQPVKSLGELVQAQEMLNDDLARFRSTHTTRKFNLQDVESFFVFFYSLNAIAKEIQNIAKSIDLLSSQPPPIDETDL